MPRTEEETQKLMTAVRQLRTALGYTQQEFAARLGMAISTVVRFEHTRTPSGKALAKLEQVAAAHGLNDLADVFRRALSTELGSVPPTSASMEVQCANDEERDLAVALLRILRSPEHAAQAKQLREMLEPMVIERRRRAELREELEGTWMAIVRLLKRGHGPKDIMAELGVSAENVGEALFRRGDPDLIDFRSGEVVVLLLRSGWSIAKVSGTFGLDQEALRKFAVDAGLGEQVRDRAERVDAVQSK